MAASSIAAFWVVAFLLIVVPGPDWAFSVSTSLRGGSVVAAVGGLAIGYATLTAVVAAGVGALVTRTPDVLTALTVAGGLYLMWHGARTFARPAPPAAAAAPPGAAAGPPASTSRALLIRGIGVSGLNPKGLLLFLAVAPQFATPRGSWPLPAQLGLLGLVFTLTCAAFYLGLGSSARKVLRTRPGAAAAVTRFSGAAMTVIGAVLLAERLLA
ncbi:MAG: LysE family translocator [Streptosporangiaceae bacterium]